MVRMLSLVLVLMAGDNAPSVPTQPPAVASPPAAIDWANRTRSAYSEYPYLTLPEAFRLALDASESVRVLSLGVSGVGTGPDGPFFPSRAQFDRIWGEFGGDRIVRDDAAISPAAVGPHDADLLVARLDADTSAWEFKASAMATLRSAEAAYWALWQAQEAESVLGRAIGRIEAALRQDQEVVNHHGVLAELAETEEILERLHPRRAAAQAARVEAEGRLRCLLKSGPTLDSPELFVAITRPLASVAPPDPGQVHRQLDHSEPRLNHARAAILAARFTDLAERPTDPTTAPVAADPEQLRADLKAARIDSAAALDRALAALDTATTEVRAAQAVHSKAATRLDAQQQFWDEGRITLDRYAVAVVAEVDATITEAQALTHLNVAAAALHEAQGTLLTHDGVNVARPRPRTRRHLAVPLDPPPINPSLAPDATKL